MAKRKTKSKKTEGTLEISAVDQAAANFAATFVSATKDVPLPELLNLAVVDRPTNPLADIECGPLPEALPDADVIEMKVITSLADLEPDDQNANAGTERGNAMLEWSMRNFGAGRSVLADKHGRLIAGNKTVEKAAELGIPIRVVTSDGTELVVVQRSDLDLHEGTAARELAYADNRVAEVGLRWSTEQLQRDMLAGLDLSAQFRMQELQALNIAELEGQGMMDGDDGGDAVAINTPTILFGRWRFRLSREDAARFEAIIAAYLATNTRMPKVHGWIIQPDLDALPPGLPSKGTLLVFGQHKFPLSEREAKAFDQILEGYIDQTGTPDGFGGWLVEKLELAMSLEVADQTAVDAIPRAGWGGGRRGGCATTAPG